MCTLSYFRLAQGYSLMMNRDESPSRPAARELRSDPQGRLYPVDPAAGGTWIGVNRAGVAFALMNQYPAGYSRPAGAQSRGRLIPLALEAKGAGAGLERVAAQDLGRTPPFILAGFEEGHAPLSLRWDGRHLERRLYSDGALMLSSSGYKPDEVLPAREAQFDLMLETRAPADDAELLAEQEAFQLSEQPEAGPFAVWMTRADSRSVSLSHVLVLPRRVTLRHRLREDLEAGRPESVAGLDR